jgi:hypothetical protein
MHATIHILRIAMVFLFIPAALFLAREAHAGLLINRTLYLGLTNGLVGHWSFDGPDMAGIIAYDRSGQNNHGTVFPNAMIEDVRPDATAAEAGGTCTTSDAHTTMDDDVDGGGDGSICTADSATADHDIRLNFAIPSINPTTGTNVQTFAVLARNSQTSGNGVAQVALHLYCNGTQRATGTNQNLGDTYAIVTQTFTFHASCAADGSDVEVLVDCTAADNGGTNHDTSCNYEAVEWRAVDAGRTPMVASGRIGQALQFDGVNDYVDVGNGSTLAITNSVTIAFWLKFNNTTPGTPQFIISKENAGGTDYYTVIKAGAGNTFRLAIATGAADAAQNSITIPTTGRFYHVVGTWDGAVMRIYVDGAEEGTPVSKSGTMANNGQPVDLGRFEPSSSNFVNGILDDVRVYNRASTKSAPPLR